CDEPNIFRARSTKCWEISAGQDRVIKLSFYLLLFLASRAVFAQEPSFRSQSNVVIVPVLVRDLTGHAIYGLHAPDFVLEDDGVEQTVQLDESVDAEPLSVMVAIQTGRRAWREFGRVQGLSGHPRCSAILGEVAEWDAGRKKESLAPDQRNPRPRQPLCNH
ncbi:MAG TPA: hypothetical protein VK579_05350, partial [Terriglobales bacterium]|nr:hypothetical protein [Terriglobales bacterium]